MTHYVYHYDLHTELNSEVVFSNSKDKTKQNIDNFQQKYYQITKFTLFLFSISNFIMSCT